MTGTAHRSACSKPVGIGRRVSADRHPEERRQDYLDAIRVCEQDGNTASFRDLVRQSWQTTLDLVREAKA